VGRVMGAQGGSNKELHTRSGAKIQIGQNFPEGVPRKISISGTQTAVRVACRDKCRLLHFHIKITTFF